ncbi:MAG: DUF4177 domain-containing protein [Proteobacteria bacterium]|nr:DUF4177 domain-containing protein [Pseudomonadota bacterium]MBU1648083.1 DUF4177 domain-containing protein [Pseudomonadota bacterium]
MRWGYKTIQYGLKKEGLLGSSFLDEAEVEQSLNEFGQAGWELVSLFGMQDGLMAVFKQQLEMKVAAVHESVTEGDAVTPCFSLKSQAVRDLECIAERKAGRKEPLVSVVVETEDIEEGVGGIRIE